MNVLTDRHDCNSSSGIYTPRVTEFSQNGELPVTTEHCYVPVNIQYWSSRFLNVGHTRLFVSHCIGRMLRLHVWTER